MKAIENGLKRFEKGTKIVNGHIVLKRTRSPKKQHRTAMSVLYDRLKNNLNNELETGVKLSKRECEVLGLDCANEFAFYYLDRYVTDNSRVAIYYK